MRAYPLPAVLAILPSLPSGAIGTILDGLVLLERSAILALALPLITVGLIVAVSLFFVIIIISNISCSTHANQPKGFSKQGLQTARHAAHVRARRVQPAREQPCSRDASRATASDTQVNR